MPGDFWSMFSSSRALVHVVPAWSAPFEGDTDFELFFFEHLTFLCCLFLGHLHLSVFPLKCQDLIHQKSGRKEANTQQSRSTDLSGFTANGLGFFRLPAYILFQLSSRLCRPDLPGQPSCGRKTRLVSNQNKSY